MANYYYVGTALPSLSFDTPPEISLTEFNHLLMDNLTKKDYEKTRLIRGFYDVLNLRSLWLNEDLDLWGNLDENELDEALINLYGLPDYVYDFLEAHPKIDDRLRHFPQLLATFFLRSAKNEPKGFLKDYLNFEREWRLVFTAFRAKKLGRDISVELQYEDLDEDLIAQILAQKDAKTYMPPENYDDLRFIFEKYSDDPLMLQRAIDEYRFNKIDELVGMEDTFSINRILGYMAQLIIVQKWFELDKKKGIQIVDKIVKELS